MLRKLDLPWLILLGAIVAASTLLWRGGEEGEAGVLKWSVGSAAATEVSLAEDQKIVIHGAIGDSVVEIRDGRVRFYSAPCPHKRCMQGGWISETGESLFCVPNQVAIELGSVHSHESENSLQLDGVTY